jgi:hypothetical protein
MDVLRPALLLGAALVAGCGYVPPVDGVPVVPNGVTGTVVVSGAVPATAVVLATSAADPPPPAGTGRPVSLATVAASAFSTSGGLMSGGYALTGLPDGDYVVTGLLDVDGDFHPRVDALAGATCGDVVGGHLASLTDPTLAAVSVAGGSLAADVTVTLARALPVERPVFYALAPNGVPGVPQASFVEAAAGNLQVVRLRSTGVNAVFETDAGATTLLARFDGPHVDDPLDPPAGNPFGLDPSDRYDLFAGAPDCDVAFLVEVQDTDDDGFPDSDPALPGTLAAWPKIGFTWLGDPVDVDGDGAFDGFDQGDVTDDWTAPGAVSPVDVMSGAYPVGLPARTTALDVLVYPAARRRFASDELACVGSWADGVCEEVVTDPARIPTGAWAITVIESTGQTWTIPNTLVGAQALDAAFVPALQGAFLWVPPPVR